MAVKCGVGIWTTFMWLVLRAYLKDGELLEGLCSMDIRTGISCCTSCSATCKTTTQRLLQFYWRKRAFM